MSERQGILKSLARTLSSAVPGRNRRVLGRMSDTVAQINALEARYKNYTDAQLRGETARFRELLRSGRTLDDLVPEAFAVVREASRRTTRLRHFDVQLMGGIALHQGKIAEMATGEGKTLVATLPAYLNALTGKGVHIVTVNDYLARRDRQWMGPIYEMLGLKVGVIQTLMPRPQRQTAYRADITYGTNKEFGFDFLRDNLKVNKQDLLQQGNYVQYLLHGDKIPPEHRCQRELNYAIVDEVDSVLIDEARTPLIISGGGERAPMAHLRADQLIRVLKLDVHFKIKEKERDLELTRVGQAEVERLVDVRTYFGPTPDPWKHYVEQALRAHHLYKKDREYIIKDGEVFIVDPFTGRVMPGRTWNEGLHRAIEVKERLRVQDENVTLLSITYQIYFRKFKKLAGMTGTASTAAAEFWGVYGLDVVSVPTNRPLRRTAQEDLIYATEKDKYDAIEAEVARLHEQGRPVLIGTWSVEKSEALSERLKQRGIAHNVLNAKQDEQEAEIVAEAGQPRAVTIATNMAGRGTDILLGEGVPELGGLHVLGTERHDARRIDNQLAGRAGRQGDPGSSQFFLSLEDDLVRVFGRPRAVAALRKRISPAGQPLRDLQAVRLFVRAQKGIEAHHFKVRKQLLRRAERIAKWRGSPLYDALLDWQQEQMC